jgi:hypothetical protein
MQYQQLFYSNSNFDADSDPNFYFAADLDTTFYFNADPVPKPSQGVADPDDPYVFGPSGSGSISSRYGSGSGSFYPQAKIVRKS